MLPSNSLGLAAVLLLAAAWPSAAQAQAVPAEWSRVWLSTFSEDGTFCLKLHDGGSAEFTEPFQVLNPISWKRESGSGELVLTLGALHYDVTRDLKAQLAHPVTPPRPDVADLIAFDEAGRTLRYRITKETQRLIFVGRLLYRPEALTRDQLALTSTNCR